MILCKHIQPIYQNEIKQGNSIAFLWKQNQYLCIALKKQTADYYNIPDIQISEEKDHHFPFVKAYHCHQCRCYICSPLDNNQEAQYRRNMFHSVSEKAIATPKTIEIEDSYWETLRDSIIPKHVGFEDKYED